jgi:hypothetical protein
MEAGALAVFMELLEEGPARELGPVRQSFNFLR